MEIRGPLHNDECSQFSKKMASFPEYQKHVNDLFLTKTKSV